MDVIVTAVRFIIAIIATVIFLCIHVVLFTIETIFAIIALPFAVFQTRKEFKKSWPANYPYIARFGIEPGEISEDFPPAPIAPINNGLNILWTWVFDE